MSHDRKDRFHIERLVYACKCAIRNVAILLSTDKPPMLYSLSSFLLFSCTSSSFLKRARAIFKDRFIISFLGEIQIFDFALSISHFIRAKVELRVRRLSALARRNSPSRLKFFKIIFAFKKSPLRSVSSRSKNNAPGLSLARGNSRSRSKFFNNNPRL